MSESQRINYWRKWRQILKSRTGYTHYFPEEIEVKMWPLPIKDLYMAGKSSVQVLKKLEINTIGALAQADPDLISLHLKSHGRMLWEFANGIGTSTVQSEPEEAKGIGNSTTLREDARTMEEVCPVFEELAQSVRRRLKKAGKKAGMVSAEIKYYDFRTLSHQMQLEKAVKRKRYNMQGGSQSVSGSVDRRTGASAGNQNVKIVG